jgi:hypothetical protein
MPLRPAEPDKWFKWSSQAPGSEAVLTRQAVPCPHHLAAGGHEAPSPAPTDRRATAGTPRTHPHGAPDAGGAGSSAPRPGNQTCAAVPIDGPTRSALDQAACSSTHQTRSTAKKVRTCRVDQGPDPGVNGRERARSEAMFVPGLRPRLIADQLNTDRGAARCPHRPQTRAQPTPPIFVT